MNGILKKIFGIGMSLIVSTSSVVTPQNYETSYQYIQRIGPQVIEYIKKRDKNGINELFCDKVKNTEYLKLEIDNFFDYIDKNGGIIIEENSQWTVPAEHYTFSDKGTGKVVHFVQCKYWGNVLINNEKYTLMVTSYLVLKKHTKYEKINQIYLLKDNNKNLSVVYKNKIAENNKMNGYSLGMGIHILNLDKLCRENVILPDVENLSDYHYSFDELEKDASNW